MKESAETSKEVGGSRYDNLPLALKVVCIVFAITAVGLAVFFIFGFSFQGVIMHDFAYYYFLYAVLLSSAYLILPARKKNIKGAPWYDVAGCFLAFGIAFYYFLNGYEIRFIAGSGWVPPTTLNFALGLIFCLLILEAGRRMAGPIYLSIVTILGLYPLFASVMSGIFWGVSFPFNELIGFLVYGVCGIAGLPGQVMGTILIGFLVFAGILIASGAGRFFLDFAMALLGQYRGGAAKVAVVSSGFFGSMSGSAVSNIVATGSVTIPAMKRIGYPPHYAAGIEACASTGGQLMPPMMGAVAFVMAIILGIEYAAIIVAAAIPAILFYWGLLVQVDAYAARAGLKGLPRKELPSIKKVLKQGWQFIFVLVFLLWGLLYMRWAEMTPFYASVLMLALSFVRRETMLTPKKFIGAIVIVGRLITQTMVVLLPVGIIIGGLTISGVAASLTTGLVSLGGENVILILVIGVVGCYILGMVGVGFVSYIFLAVTLAPAIIQLGGLNTLAVHLFLIYYAMLSLITLPVAAGAFIAASLATAPPMRTALTAMRLGIVIYFIPFFFIFNPALVLQGPIFDTLYLFALCLVGIALIAAGVEGYLVKIGRLKRWARPGLVIVGFLIAFPEWLTTIIGVILALLVIGLILFTRKTAEKLETGEVSVQPGKANSSEVLRTNKEK